MTNKKYNLKSPRFKDISGQVFGRWSVLGYAGNNEQGTALWSCRCECGTVRAVAGERLRRGHSLSCGCLQLDTAQKHGMSYRTEYKIWSNIKQRCFNPKNCNYPNYGARGIRVCASWLESFESFLHDMGARPTPTHSIERKDNNGDYSPDNCCWATQKEQTRNRRNSHFLILNGESHTVSEWAEITGIAKGTITSRLMRGWPDERILTKPVRSK